jgi:hypothetical protein
MAAKAKDTVGVGKDGSAYVTLKGGALNGKTVRLFAIDGGTTIAFGDDRYLINWSGKTGTLAQ